MSAGGAFGGARGYTPKPPEKGVFPLDHFGECKQVKEAYLQCLQQHNNDADACRELTKAYLQCRMDRNLMARQNLAELGFIEQATGPKAVLEQPAKQQQQPQQPQPSEQLSDRPAPAREGFVAGTLRFKKPSST